jgi:putative transposase
MEDPALHQGPHRRRLRRFDGQGHARFLTFSCFHQQPFLRSARACQWLIDAIDRARQRHRFKLWAYVIMPEHAHILVWPDSACDQVSQLLYSIKQSVTQRAVRWARDHASDKLHQLADTAPNGKVIHRFWQRGGGHD